MHGQTRKPRIFLRGAWWFIMPLAMVHPCVLHRILNLLPDSSSQFYSLIKFIFVTLVHIIIYVSSAHFYGTRSVYSTVCPPPEVKTSFVTIYCIKPLQPPSPTSTYFSLATTTLLSVFMSFSFISHV